MPDKQDLVPAPLRQEGVPSQPAMTPFSAASSSLQHGPSTTLASPYEQGQLVWLRTDLEAEHFRRFVQNMHVEGLAEDDEAPPEYS